MCRSTLGVVWVVVDMSSLETVTLNCDGKHEILEIPDRTLRRLLRNLEKVDDPPLDVEEDFATYFTRKKDAMISETLRCLTPFIDEALSPVPSEKLKFCFR